MSHTIAALAIIAVVAAVQFYVVEWLAAKLLPWAKEAELEFIT
jgi:ABC-type nitrate/sulfonate/bicarbonate transport system permease component